MAEIGVTRLVRSGAIERKSEFSDWRVDNPGQVSQVGAETLFESPDDESEDYSELSAAYGAESAPRLQTRLLCHC